jgi:hypothetical protein
MCVAAAGPALGGIASSAGSCRMVPGAEHVCQIEQSEGVWKLGTSLRRARPRALRSEAGHAERIQESESSSQEVAYQAMPEGSHPAGD